MNKAELKNFVAELAGTTKKDAGIAIDAVLEGIRTGVIEDGKVTLVGFGTFTTAVRKARKARNPKTGEAVDVPAKIVPKFKPSAKFKETLASEVSLDETDIDEADSEILENEDNE